MSDLGRCSYCFPSPHLRTAERACRGHSGKSVHSSREAQGSSEHQVLTPPDLLASGSHEILPMYNIQLPLSLSLLTHSGASAGLSYCHCSSDSTCKWLSTSRLNRSPPRARTNQKQAATLRRSEARRLAAALSLRTRKESDHN